MTADEFFIGESEGIGAPWTVLGRSKRLFDGKNGAYNELVRLLGGSGREVRRESSRRQFRVQTVRMARSDLMVSEYIIHR